MPFCPITLDPVADGAVFSPSGLRSLHPRLTRLCPLDLTHAEQLRQARLRSDKMSVQGVQPKLSAVLRVGEGRFQIVDCAGKFILKPNPPPFEEVPANESLTMTLASLAGIEVPPHGLIPSADGSWIYVIRRFDREGRDRKRHVEDFAQLSDATRETKYDSSLERVAAIVEDYCTFPAIEKAALARRLLFCFLTGNEDMHLKNFSLIVRQGRTTLAPAYDLLNSTVVLENATEESALPLAGKKRKLSRELWIDYYCRDRLRLETRIIDGILSDLSGAVPRWRDLVARSFLSAPRQAAYLEILSERVGRLRLG